ncbi:hypothetical protein [Zhihengliuella flava]|uniref:Uncharacterized protein n=1 Tax=Zhihengliuella flava TaxID=1285193 RepID=A0A931D829_9MICC|nr:hypothetical protein [Zhihengliuella flava]MBG6083728.1 hypothetical protein [Zhihengliuella flava]
MGIDGASSGTESEEPRGAPDAAAHPHINAAMERLGGLEDRPLPEHPDELDAVHEHLRRALDDEPASPSTDD